jgi:hypothetical protein
VSFFILFHTLSHSPSHINNHLIIATINMGKNNQSKRPHKRRSSKGSRDKNNKKHSERYHREAGSKRADGYRERLGTEGITYKSVGPLIPVNEERKMVKSRDCSEETSDFYWRHPDVNHWIEVSERSNLSNPEGVKGGGKGVFAIKDIPAKTRICPYVGKIRSGRCSPDKQCMYDLRLDKDYYLCARDEVYDTGYFSQKDQETWNGGRGLLTTVCCPPNYGRFINSLTAAQLADGMDYNCTMEHVDDGHDVVFIETTEAVQKGEELVMDYGTSFTIA